MCARGGKGASDLASLFIEIAVRAALIAAGTAVVLWALRIKTPAVRHSAWTAVLLGMLLLPIWSVSGLKVLVPVLPARADAHSPATDPVSTPPPATRHRRRLRHQAPPHQWRKSPAATVIAYGRYSLLLEYAPDERTPGDTFDPFARIRRERGAPPPPPGTGPSIFKAVELLGLKLAPTRGPAEYLQIDSVQRPRPN